MESLGGEKKLICSRVRYINFSKSDFPLVIFWPRASAQGPKSLFDVQTTCHFFAWFHHVFIFIITSILRMDFYKLHSQNGLICLISPCFDIPWHVLIRFEFFDIFWHFWSHLTTFWLFWHRLTTFDHFFTTFQHFDHFLSLDPLTRFDTFCPSWLL